MPRKSKSFERFWQELKRRKVVQVVTAYAAVSFVILQVVDIIAQPLDLPGWTLRYLIILLCIGLIIAGILSWVYDITSKGIMKTESLETIEAKKSEDENQPSESSYAWKVTSYISIGIIVILLSYNIFNWGKTTELARLEKSVAVLPFINDSSSDSTTYFINGVMEDILNDLQKIKDLRVISRRSVEQFRNTTKPIPVIAKELGVNFIVEGSGQKSGSAFHLSSQLLRAKKESHLWGKTFEQEIHDAKDVFRIQSQIAQSIATELEAVITPQEKILIEKTQTSSLSAYENYILGMYHVEKLTKEDFDFALNYFEKAKEIDPDYADAYLGIAYVWMWRSFQSFATPEEVAPIAKSNIAKAFKLDSTSAEVYVNLALFQMTFDVNLKSAEESIEKAISLNPNYEDAHVYYATLLLALGQPEEAVEQEKIALKLDPMNTGLKPSYGMNLYFAGKYNEAIKVFHEVLNTDPGNVIALDCLPAALHAIGRYSEELEAWKADYSKGFKGYANVFDQGYAIGGLTGALNLEADSLVKQLNTKFILPWEIAQIYACAGNKERTLEMLEEDYEVHDPTFVFVLRYPAFVFVHDEPRFQNLFHKIFP